MPTDILTTMKPAIITNKTAIQKGSHPAKRNNIIEHKNTTPETMPLLVKNPAIIVRTIEIAKEIMPNPIVAEPPKIPPTLSPIL